MYDSASYQAWHVSGHNGFPDIEQYIQRLPQTRLFSFCFAAYLAPGVHYTGITL